MEIYELSLRDFKSPFDIYGQRLYFFDAEFQKDFKQYAPDIQTELVIPEVEWSVISDVLSYYRPYLYKKNLKPSHSWLSAIRYQGVIPPDFNPKKTVVLKSFLETCFVDLTNSGIDELADLVERYFKSDEGMFFSPNYNEDEEHFPLDDETLKIVKDIQDKFHELNKTGKFLFALPDIYKYLEEFRTVQKPIISQLYINPDFQIFLTDYGNQEIKLSHLTKSLYFLHLIHGKLDLDDIRHHRKTLLNIYKTVSYRTDLEKLEESVEKLLQNESNELFIHYSRIKSAFCKIMDDGFAKHYYIRGDRGQKKGLSLEKDKIKFEVNFIL